MENKKRRRIMRKEKALKSVPEDLIPEIISRVPAKDLMRFIGVSKSWCSLICTDPSFVRLQLERTASLDPFVLIEKVLGKTWSYYNYGINLDSIEDESMNLQVVDNPFNDVAQVVGLCHGLLAFKTDSGRILKVAVSNPTTKKHVIVPPPNEDSNAIGQFCGFGYDHVHDCYKLVTRVHHQDRTLELMVCDLNKGTWRSLQFGTWWKSQYEHLDDSHCYRDLIDYRMVCADGVVYWCIVVDENRLRELRMMVCFVLAEEEFHVVKPPDLGEVKYYPNMTLLEGRLGLVCRGLDRRHEFWSIQLDCVDGKRQWRWTKLLAMSDPHAMLPNAFLQQYNHIVFMVPVCFSACRSKILVNVRGHLFWYDIGKKEFRKLNNHPLYSCCDRVRTFVPSLARIGLF